MRKLPNWLLPTLLVIFFGAIFLFRLGWGSLQSYDEAWYGSIAREVLRSPNPLRLVFNGRTFTDHPPGLFWLMGGLYGVFGVSEWSTRLLSALTGAGSVLLVYLLGQRLGSRLAGLSASTMLGSSLWFVYRARSGNLDVPFLFFCLLTIYLALLASQRHKLLPLVALSFGWLLISKTLIGLALLVPLAIILAPSLWKNRTKWRPLVYSLLTFAAVLLPWYIYNAWHDGAFLRHNLFEIGTRGGSVTSLQLDTQLLYLRSGIGKWFMLFGAALPLVLLSLRRYSRSLLILFLWLLALGLPFMLNPRTEIWHLIPIYPPLMLIASFSLIGFSHWLAGRLTRLTKLPKRQSLKLAQALPLLATLSILIIAAWQLWAVIKITLPKHHNPSLEADIALRSRAYPGRLHLKEVVGPTIIFYADRELNSFGHATNSYQYMTNLLTTSPQLELIIIKANELPQLTTDKVPYRLLEQNPEYALVGNIPVIPDWPVSDQ